MSEREHLKLFNGSAERADFRGDVYTVDGRMYWVSSNLRVESLDDDFTVHVASAEAMRDLARENNHLEFVELVDKALAGEGWAADRVSYALWRARYSSPLKTIRTTNTKERNPEVRAAGCRPGECRCELRGMGCPERLL